MYKVTLHIRQAPGAVFDLLKLKRTDIEGNYSIHKLEFVVHSSVRVKAHLGFFNNMYINFSGGRSMSGDFYGIVSKNSTTGISINWSDGKPPVRISRWGFS